MRKQMIVAGAVMVAVGLGAVVALRRGKGQEAKPFAVQRQNVELTVYKSDFGMVRETRAFDLKAGSNKLHVPDVSRQLDPQSVLLNWQGNANGLQLVAHAYDLGVANPETLMKRYLGQEVEVVRYGENGHEAERQKGRLMVGAGSEIVLQTEDKFFINPQGTVVAPTNPDIITIPQLSVQAESPAAQSANLSVAYLTRGLSWSADYVATLAPQGNALSLECWATVLNQTGANYPSAKVTLMAGSPNRAVQVARQRQLNEVTISQDYYDRESRKGASMMAKASFGGSLARGFGGGAPEAVGEGQAYAIKNPTTVVQDQMNRLLMLSSANVSLIRDYSATPPMLYAWGGYEYGWGTPAQPTRGGVQVALTFFNKEKDGLGLPLPAGAIRLYEPDSAGTLRYAGAANVQDTPKDQKVNITLARAFDLFTEWKLLKSEKVDKRTNRKQIELTLHNEKKTPVTLRLVQTFGGRWKMVHEDDKHVNLDANRAEWKINVPAGGNVPFRYTVDMSYS